MTIGIKNIEELEVFGKVLGKKLSGGEIIMLNGELGAGKTTLSKFIAKGMGIRGNIQSPTFAILNIHEGEIPLYHFDFYRINDLSSFDDLGFDDYFFGDGVCIIEWGKAFREILPSERIEIDIEKLEENSRRLTVNATEKYQSIIANLK